MNCCSVVALKPKTPMWLFCHFFSTGTYARIGTGEFEIKMKYAKKINKTLSLASIWYLQTVENFLLIFYKVK